MAPLALPLSTTGGQPSSSPIDRWRARVAPGSGDGGIVRVPAPTSPGSAAEGSAVQGTLSSSVAPTEYALVPHESAQSLGLWQTAAQAGGPTVAAGALGFLDGTELGGRVREATGGLLELSDVIFGAAVVQRWTGAEPDQARDANTSIIHGMMCKHAYSGGRYLGDAVSGYEARHRPAGVEKQIGAGQGAAAATQSSSVQGAPKVTVVVEPQQVQTPQPAPTAQQQKTTSVKSSA